MPFRKSQRGIRNPSLNVFWFLLRKHQRRFMALAFFRGRADKNLIPRLIRDVAARAPRQKEHLNNFFYDLINSIVGIDYGKF